MIKLTVNGLPESINKLYQGRTKKINKLVDGKFVQRSKVVIIKNEKANNFEAKVIMQIIRNKISNLNAKKYFVKIKFGVFRKNKDVDNLLKCAIDSISQNEKGTKKFFIISNDKKIYKLLVEKIDVKRSEEFTEYEIQDLEKESI
jgi:K+ transporter